MNDFWRAWVTPCRTGFKLYWIQKSSIQDNKADLYGSYLNNGSKRVVVFFFLIIASFANSNLLICLNSLSSTSIFFE